MFKISFSEFPRSTPRWLTSSSFPSKLVGIQKSAKRKAATQKTTPLKFHKKDDRFNEIDADRVYVCDKCAEMKQYDAI